MTDRRALVSTCAHNVVQLSFGNVLVVNQMILDKLRAGKMGDFIIRVEKKINKKAFLCVFAIATIVMSSLLHISTS